MISLKRNGNFKHILERVELIDKEFNSGSFLEGVAQLLNSSIQTRVQEKGRGTDNRVMNAYSNKYAASKKKSGRQTAVRDLTYSGKMWQSLTTAGIPGGAKMFFSGVENANKARGNELRAPFFGIGPKERSILKRELRKLINVN